MKVFLPEHNCFAEEFEVKLFCNNYPLFFSSCPTDWLENMLIINEQAENFEMCAIIKTEIEARDHFT